MKTQLDPQNCIGVRTFAEQHGRTDLVRKTDQFILANFEEVTNSDEFVNITPQTMTSLISSPDLNVRSERRAYEAVMKWVRHSVDARKRHLACLLQNIRFTHIPAEFIIKVRFMAFLCEVTFSPIRKCYCSGSLTSVGQTLLSVICTFLK